MYTLQRNGRSQIVPVAGERTYSRLINGVQSHHVTLVARATVQISVAAATATLNRGSVWSLFDEVGIDENGSDAYLMHGRVLRFLSEMSAPSPLDYKRLTSTAVGTYTLVEAARIYFAHPYAVTPRETAFIERDTRQLFQVFVKLNSTPANALLTVGGATVAVTAVSVDVIHGYDSAETKRPLFIPRVRQQVDSVAATNAALPIYLKTPHAIRALVLSQETTTVGEVGDIINKVVLRGDFHSIIGPTVVGWENLTLDGEFEFGGASGAAPNAAALGTFGNEAHWGINFQAGGRLSAILNPNQDSNLRWEVDCRPSVSAGSSQIRTTIVELMVDPMRTEPLTIPV